MKIMGKMAEAVLKESKDTPITVKMRAGWNDKRIIENGFFN